MILPLARILILMGNFRCAAIVEDLWPLLDEGVSGGLPLIKRRHAMESFKQFI